MLSRFVIAFLPRSKCLIISRLQSPSAVILEPKKIKSVTVFTFSPSICHEMMGPDAMIMGSSVFSPRFFKTTKNKGGLDLVHGPWFYNLFFKSVSM